eukprot:10945670-Alexandrium_andersonii.AAC.1
MSASLVGSEMCIRDRAFTVARRLRRYGVYSGAAFTAERRAAARCLQPVSYTHLTLPTICSV